MTVNTRLPVYNHYTVVHILFSVFAFIGSGFIPIECKYQKGVRTNKTHSSKGKLLRTDVVKPVRIVITYYTFPSNTPARYNKECEDNKFKVSVSMRIVYTYDIKHCGYKLTIVKYSPGKG